MRWKTFNHFAANLFRKGVPNFIRIGRYYKKTFWSLFSGHSVYLFLCNSRRLSESVHAVTRRAVHHQRSLAAVHSSKPEREVTTCRQTTDGQKCCAKHVRIPCRALQYSIACDKSLTTSEPWCLSGGKREDYQNCSVLYCVLKLCTVICTLR